MLNKWTHLVAAIALVITAIIIHLMIRNNANVESLDKARYYTMRRFKGDIDGAKALVSNDDTWLSTPCRASVSFALPTTNACVEERRALRNKILNAMGCFQHNSQVCTYLRNITAGIIQNRTINGNTTAVGRSLTGSVTTTNKGTITYRQLLFNAVEKAPLLFHNSFRADETDDNYVLRTALYNFIALSILGNILVHIFDTWEMSWGTRLAMRLTIFLATTFLFNFLYLLGATGSLLTAFLAIWLPGLVVLVYFEAFLDHTIVRPWIHPYVVSVIYASISILALVENGVLNTTIITLAVCQAQAVSMLYLQIVWYWAGKDEKHTHHVKDAPHLTKLYKTKEMQIALYLGLLCITVLPILQALGPFDYMSDLGDIVLRVAPIGFIILAVAGTLKLQQLKLEDDYKSDKEFYNFSTKEEIIRYATRITSGKLGVSLLLLVFGALYELNMVGEYIRGLRAYYDKMPERAWQYDVASKYTIGTGFFPTPTLYQ